jgi:hypothetical protein
MDTNNRDIETVTPQEYWSKRSNRSSFMRRLFAVTAPIISKHLKRFAKDPMNESFETMGDNQERFLKSLVDRVGMISEYFDDVFLTLTFLQVDKAKISALYGESLVPEQYYKFHYDNFLIRMVTSLDICAKLGNVVFDLRISERKMYPLTFYEHPSLKTECSAEILKEFADYLDTIKKDRHRKVHQGTSKENMFNRVLFWENLNKAMDISPEEQDSVLEEFTQSKISEVLREIETITTNSIEYVVGFLDSMLPRLEVILSDYRE